MLDQGVLTIQASSSQAVVFLAVGRGHGSSQAGQANGIENQA